MTPTKADPLIERLKHAFGERHIREALSDMMRADPLEWLTDDGRDELVHRLIAEHKSARRYAELNRRNYRKHLSGVSR